MAMKQEIVFKLLHEQHITPEEAEVLMQEPEWKYNPNTWAVPDPTLATPSNPLDWPSSPCQACRNGGTCNCILGGYKVTCGTGSYLGTISNLTTPNPGNNTITIK